MRRRFDLVWIGLVLATPALAQSPTPQEKQATLAWLHALQTEIGGFAADRKPDSPATLPATSSALRAIKYFGGDVPKKAYCAAFVQGCYHKDSASFSSVPRGRPDVRSTALGIMAAVELDIRDLINGSQLRQQVQYWDEQVKGFEDIRITAAAIESRTEAWDKRSAAFKKRTGSVVGMSFVAEPPKKWDEWRATVAKMQSADGTAGQGDGVARETAGVVVTMLRMGEKYTYGGGTVRERDNVVKVLKSGQRPDGGWGKEGEKASDLESTYRVMRAFHMLKEKPNVEACRKFVASCRNADGSYGVQPGQPGNVSATYFAGLVLHWLDGMK